MQALAHARRVVVASAWSPPAGLARVVRVVPPCDDAGMTEHQFASERHLDYSELVDEFRCRTTAWIHRERERVVRAQRALRVRELALVRVLDERGQVDDSLAVADGVSVRAVHEARATAEALEALPAIAASAAAGLLSTEQLTAVVKVADASTDEHWASEAPKWSPRDLADEARRQRTPTAAEAQARRAARELRFWWRADQGMLDGRFSLPDVDGALFESVLSAMIDRMRPARGQPWDTRARRGADALMDLVRSYAGRRADDLATSPPAHLVVQVPLRGPATIAGIPLADQTVERLRADARVEPVLVDDAGVAIAVGRTGPALSEKTKRIVRQRDGKCRWPGCERRIALEVHHCWPRSWGGADHPSNLATVCATHHAQLAPQGPLLLLGNPHHPAGLSLVHRDDLPALAYHRPTEPCAEPRAGPDAA